MKIKHNLPAKKTSFKLTAMLLGMGSLVPAHAFLNDTSGQKIVMIGKGGAENMQRLQVQELAPVSNVSTMSNTQTYQTHQSFDTPAYRDYSTTTIVPSQSQNQSQNQGYTNYNSHYNNTGYNAYTPPPTTTYHNTNYNNYGYNSHYNQFDRLALTTNSAAVAVIDLQSGKSIYEKNIDVARSIASITKMMTAMVLIDNNEDMRQEIVLKASDLVGAKNASTRLKAGDRLSRSEFMLMMLMKSENPAAKTLASSSYLGYDGFIRAMNQKAQSLGMTQTHFSDSSGLNPRNISSARDLVVMMREIATNPRYQTIRSFSAVPSYDFYITNYNSGDRVYKANNTSTLVRSGNHVINASKTGFIREAGHCVVMETTVNGRPSIIVLLGANGSQNRWNDAENILGQLAYR